jgi:hypothetical protein
VATLWEPPVEISHKLRTSRSRRGHQFVEAVSPQLNVRMQVVCTFIGTFCKYTTRIMPSLKRCSRCYWSAVRCDGRVDCSSSRLTALLLGRLLGVLLFTEARSMGRNFSDMYVRCCRPKITVGVLSPRPAKGLPVLRVLLGRR